MFIYIPANTLCKTTPPIILTLLCMCACACVHVCVRAYVCVCVRERVYSSCVFVCMNRCLCEQSKKGANIWNKPEYDKNEGSEGHGVVSWDEKIRK